MEILQGKGRQLGKSLLAISVALLITGVAEWFYFAFNIIDFDIPILVPVDGMTGISGLKDLVSNGKELLGWPFFQDASEYGIAYGSTVRLLYRVVNLFTGDVNVTYNIYLFSIPLLNAFVCFLVFRHFKIRGWLALLAAMCFGFCPYVQYRLLPHMLLAKIECIPLVFMLCIWCWEDPDFNRPGKGWTRNWRNWAALALAWLIADNGMVYYPFFSCFILLVTAVCLCIRERKVKAALPPLVLIAEVAGWLGTMFIPPVIGMLQGAGNMATGDSVRIPGDGAIRGSLRINALLLSPKGLGIPAVAEQNKAFRELLNYYDIFRDQNEPSYAYMGLVAVIGFLLLLACLFFLRTSFAKSGKLGSRLTLLSYITIMIVLLAVQSGLGTLVNIVILYIRWYSRFAPFLVFAGVFTVVLCLEWGLKKCKEAHPRGKALTVLLSGLLVVFFAYALWEQCGVYYDTTAEGNEERENYYLNDELFVKTIEEDAGEGAMIFQLPYIRPFENGQLYNMPDYDHLRGKDHSDTLRWSFGAPAGSKNDIWYKETSELPPRELVAELYEQGFSGIWMNLTGYMDNDGDQLLLELLAAAHCEEPVYCEDGHTVYIPLSDKIRYHLDPKTKGISEIEYTATQDVIQQIRGELQGTEEAIEYCADALAANGKNGDACTITLPKGKRYYLYCASAAEQYCQQGQRVVDEHDLVLKNAGGYKMAASSFPIKEKTIYRVDLLFDEDADLDSLETLTLDFYGGQDYHRAEHKRDNFNTGERSWYRYYFYSGEVPNALEDCQVRVYTSDKNVNIKLDSLTVTEMKMEDTDACAEIEVAGYATDLTMTEAGDCMLASMPIELKANRLYKIELDLPKDTDLTTVDDLAVDFFAGDEYDSLDQQRQWFIEEGKYSYTIYLYSGVYTDEEYWRREAASVPILWYMIYWKNYEKAWSAQARVVSYKAKEPLQIDSLRVTEVRRVPDMPWRLQWAQ